MIAVFAVAAAIVGALFVLAIRSPKDESHD